MFVNLFEKSQNAGKREREREREGEREGGKERRSANKYLEKVKIVCVPQTPWVSSCVWCVER